MASEPHRLDELKIDLVGGLFPTIRAARLPIAEDPGHQFDFWLGEWDVLNKHLRGGAWVDSGVGVALIQSVAGGNGKPGIRWLDGEVAGDSVTFLGTTGSISLREKWVLVDGKVLEFERSESADPDQGWISVLRTQFEPTAVQNP